MLYAGCNDWSLVLGRFPSMEDVTEQTIARSYTPSNGSVQRSGKAVAGVMEISS